MATDTIVRDAQTSAAQKVTSSGRAHVVAYSEPEAFANVLNEHGFVWHISRTPTGANDEFGYFYNGSAYNAIIDRIIVTDAGAENLLLAVCTGTPVGGTNATPVNLYAGSAVTVATISSLNVVQDGVDITGLTLGATLDTIVTGAGTTVERAYDHLPIVVPPGYAVCLSAVTGTAAIVADVYFHFCSEAME